MSKVFFRVDAGPKIGLGHLQRCLSLALAFLELGRRSHFLTNAEPKAQDRITKFGFKGEALALADSWGSSDLAKTIALATQTTSDIIVIDSDYEGDHYLRELRNAGFFICAIDDNASYTFSSHVVVNGDAHAKNLRYHSTAGDTHFLLGPKFSMMRKEFWGPPPRKVQEVVKKVLVVLGGSDPFDLMPKVLQMLDELPGEFEVSAIIGPFSTNTEKVFATAKRLTRRTEIVLAPSTVRNLMSEADIAISAGGQTLYELACVGCPTVGVQVADNQDGQIREFVRSGFLRLAGHASEIKIIEKLDAAVRNLLPDPGSRVAMAQAGQKLVDGKGALRVARSVLQLARQTKG